MVIVFRAFSSSFLGLGGSLPTKFPDTLDKPNLLGFFNFVLALIHALAEIDQPVSFFMQLPVPMLKKMFYVLFVLVGFAQLSIVW